MIEIKKGESGLKDKILIDEVEIQNVYISDYSWNGDKITRYYFIKISGFKNTAILSQQNLNEFPDKLTLRFHNWLNLSGFYLAVDVDTVAYSFSKKTEFVEGKNVSLVLKIVPYLENWKFEYSFNDYKTKFDENWKESFNSDIGNIDWISSSKNTTLNLQSIEINPYLSKTFLSDFSNETISEIIAPFIESILDCHHKTTENLEEIKINGTLSTSFDFPEEFKTSCKQYLLYFAQFLQDLGVNATSNLREEAGKVLFSVTPTDDVEALDKIREALAVYLNLPASPIVYGDSFAAMRLQQQIENLQHSQKMAVREIQVNEKLLLAQSDMIREKNLTISQQQTVIEQKDKIIEKISSKSIMMDSVENKEELEEIYEGVKVGESETLKKWLGLSLNPAKAIKTAVKNTFGKDEKKSVLGLDEGD